MQGADEDFSTPGPWTGRKPADTLMVWLWPQTHSQSHSSPQKKTWSLFFLTRGGDTVQRMKPLHDPLRRMAVNGKHSVLGGEKPRGKQKTFSLWFPIHHLKSVPKGDLDLQVSSNMGIIFMFMNLYLFLKEGHIRLKDPQGKTPVWRVMKLMTLSSSSVLP